MANGTKTFAQRYAEVVIGVFCTLGSVVYFTQLPIQFARKTTVTALQTQVNKDSAKTTAAVNQVKEQTSQAAGSAIAAQTAAADAKRSADEAAQHRAFMSANSQKRFEILERELRSNRREIDTVQDQINAIRQGR